MIIDITDAAVTLTDPDDCGRFHVRVPAGVPMETIGGLLAAAGAGQLTGPDQVAVDVGWLRSSARDVASDWDDRFDKMLAFAGTKGWLTDDGAAVLGHISHD